MANSSFDGRPTEYVDVGDLVNIQVTFRNSSDTVIDPTSVTFQYKSAILGVVTSLTYGVDAAVVRVSTGIYYVNIDTTASHGIWVWSFTATGTGQAVIAGKFIARESAVVETGTIDPGTVSGVGLVAHLSSTNYIARTLVAGSASLAVTNGTGFGGNPSIDTVQNIQTSATPTFASLSLSATANQITLQSAGVTGKITATPTSSNKTWTLPDLTGTVALKENNLSVFAATTSAQLAGVISDETGSGLLVFATSPTLTTPVLGVATATTINKVTLTAPASGSTLTIADGKVLTVSNTLTFTGTDASSVAFGAGGTAAFIANKLSVFAATSSSELAGVISDETGTNKLVFSTAPTFDTSITLGAAGGTTGSIIFKGTTSGTVTLTVAASANAGGAAYTLTLPTDDGTSGQLLATDGNGVLSWSTPVSTTVSYSAQSGSFNAASGSAYWITGNSVVATLPAGPANNDVIYFASGSSSITGFSVARNGNKIMNSSTDLTVDTPEFWFKLTYRSATTDWRFTD